MNPFRTAQNNLATHIFKVRYVEGGKGEGDMLVVVVVRMDKLPHKDQKAQTLTSFQRKIKYSPSHNNENPL